MQSASDQITRPAARTFASMVAPQFRKDVQLAGLESYQSGIRTAVMWPNKPQCLRVIPGFDQETGEIYPQIKPGRPYTIEYLENVGDYLSDSFYSLRTMSGLGESRNTVIASYRPGSPEAQRWAGNTVLHWFAADVSRAVRSAEEGRQFHLTPQPEWTRWVTYDAINRKMPVLPFDRETLLFQALVWTLNGRENTMKTNNGFEPIIDNEGNPLPVLYLLGLDNSNSMKELQKALIEPLDPSKPLDGLNNSKYHGIAELDGSILYLLPGTVSQKDKKQNVLQPHVSSDPSDWSVTPYPLTEDQVHSWWKPWDQLLNFMTPEEQCELLAGEFGADTVNYVIGNCAALRGLEIPESVAKAGLGRYSAYQTKQASGAPSGFGVKASAPAFGKPASTAARPAFGRPAEQAEPEAVVKPKPVVAGLKPSGPNVKSEVTKLHAAMRPNPSKADKLVTMAQDLVGDVDYNDDNTLLPGLED